MENKNNNIKPIYLVEKFELLSRFLENNFSKKVLNISINMEDDSLLLIELSGKLDESDIEKIMDNFPWINGVDNEFKNEIIFNIDY